MRKKLIFAVSISAFVLFASSTGCNDDKQEKVASKEISNEDEKKEETKNDAASNIDKVEEERMMVIGEEPENIKKCPKVLISTPFGDMKIALYNSTPVHRDNFIKLVEDGFYEDLLFHRVIQNFMIQGGDPNSRGAAEGQRLGTGGPGYTLEAEFNSMNIHKKGALAAARTGGPGNPKKRSSGSQFYIVQGQVVDSLYLQNLERRIRTFYPESADFKYSEEQIEIYATEGGTPGLDMDYTVFGEVIEGFDVIDKIAAVQKDKADRPLEDVKMTMKVVKK